MKLTRGDLIFWGATALFYGAILFGIVSFAPLVWERWTAPPDLPRLLSVCDPSVSMRCHCVDSELEWKDGLVFCWEKGTK